MKTEIEYIFGKHAVREVLRERPDVVIEAIFENADAKKKLYADLEPRMKKREQKHYDALKISRTEWRELNAIAA